MERYLTKRLVQDLTTKLVFLTGPRQVGKTVLSRHLMAERSAQYLNYDVLEDRAVLERRSWLPDTSFLVLDELHKMHDWKAWVKGLVDGRPSGQRILVTGSARLETFRQSGESLAGRFRSLRLHPISVREWCELAPDEPAYRSSAGIPPTPDQALDRLLKRGGFPEPVLAVDAVESDRWRRQYIDGLIREDILEFSRVHELGAMRLLVDLLRQRVGSPLSMASIAEDLGVSQPTVRRYLEILEALFIVFVVPPWRRNIARALIQQPKIYFHDVGLVRAEQGIRFENLIAVHLLKHVQWQQDAFGRDCGLHYIRTKDGAEVDFVIVDDGRPIGLVECKWSDVAVHRPLARFAEELPGVAAVQAVRHLRQPEQRGRVAVLQAAPWLAGLSA